ncbi:hypothetical protein FVEG_05342 [Fusarium verticillioides 7600]|uniref:Uncharacterized protein n=1 Tax=Gibberella moniliformis (strain M3125 / FGSC 7600) TaxID=334819 RepID=W7LY26_GIBM7|nr:hypothetical protein FVEG_05342 [Fusarium verticillioides 7600]EWG44193.1 hypothetical protein FVEG_05342 [Fusarium verticillioides 7600]
MSNEDYLYHHYQTPFFFQTLLGTMMTLCSGCRNWNVGGSKISSHAILPCILKDIHRWTEG